MKKKYNFFTWKKSTPHGMKSNELTIMKKMPGESGWQMKRKIILLMTST